MLDTMEKLLDALEQVQFKAYGIRCVDGTLEAGQELDPSYDWEDSFKAQEEEKLLPGTCATGFACLWFDDDQERTGVGLNDRDTVKQTLNIQRQYGRDFKDPHRYLIYGRCYDYGNDENELIISDAVVFDEVDIDSILEDE